MKPKAFICSGLTLGGIYTFKLRSKKRYTSQFNKKATRFHFSGYDFSEDSHEIIGNKQLVFGKDQKWSVPELNLKLVAGIDLNLANGRQFTDLVINVYASVYYRGFSTILFWVDTGDFELNYNQIVELVSLINNNRFDNDTIKRITFKQGHTCIEYVCLFNLFCDIQKDLELNLQIESDADSNISNHIYPITYIQEVKNCFNSSDIIKNFGKEVVGICDNWTHYHTHFKEAEIKRILDTDLHPFDYGVSVYTSAGMVELHSSNFRSLNSITNYTLPQQHFYEQTFLYIITEVSILHLFVLKWFDHQLTLIGLKAFKSHWNFVAYIRDLKKITNLHNSTIESLSLFKDAHFASKSYIPHTIQGINNILGINKFSESVSGKLNDIKQQLTITYSMITTVFVIILTFIGLLIGLSQIAIALRQKPSKKETVKVISKPLKVILKANSSKSIVGKVKDNK